MFIHQANYIDNIIKRFSLEKAHSVAMPMENKFQLNNAKSCDESLPYREIIGLLIFLASVTRPDISYSVNYLSPFLANYDNSHWQAAKRKIKYLLATKNFDILYDGSQSNSSELITGYSDADFAGDVKTRRSTSGYVFTMSGGPVHMVLPEAEAHGSQHH